MNAVRIHNAIIFIILDVQNSLFSILVKVSDDLVSVRGAGGAVSRQPTTTQLAKRKRKTHRLE